MKADHTSYSVHELAEVSGVSVRTLHYYDELGLLQPIRQSNNYRSYGVPEVDRLQQILLYREIGMNLTAIKGILDNPDFDACQALQDHLQSLRMQRTRIDRLIANVEKTLAAQEGGPIMDDKEKFESFKKKMVDENEEKYGNEIREKYGDDAIDASNAKMMNMTEEKYRQNKDIEARMNGLFAEAMDKGDPACEEAQKACDLHREWLIMFWKDGTYSKEAHRSLGEMYASDDRFKAYYEKIRPGMAEFLRDALKVYTA